MPEGCMLSPLKRAWVLRGLAHPQLKLGSNRMPAEGRQHTSVPIRPVRVGTRWSADQRRGMGPSRELQVTSSGTLRNCRLMAGRRGGEPKLPCAHN